MAWIESHQELARHPKTKKLARLLSTPLPSIIGHLHMLWWWAMDYAEDGDLSKFDAYDVADAVMWEGDAENLLGALVDAGFLDRTESGFCIHDWRNYIGKLLDKREADRERKARAAEAKKNAKGTPREQAKASVGIPEEILRNSDGSREDSETVPDVTVTYTVPNRTKPYQTRSTPLLTSPLGRKRLTARHVLRPCRIHRQQSRNAPESQKRKLRTLIFTP